MRFRNIYLIIGTILTVLIWLLTDPDSGIIQSLHYGSSLVATLVILFKSILYVGVLHISRKALCDYLDLELVCKKAMQTEHGAGLVAIAVSIIMLSIAIVMYAATSS
jgi:hypothetical protein